MNKSPPKIASDDTACSVIWRGRRFMEVARSVECREEGAGVADRAADHTPWHRRLACAFGARRSDRISCIGVSKRRQPSLSAAPASPLRPALRLGRLRSNDRLPRPRVGRAGPRRPPALRVADPRRRAGRSELGHDPSQARELPRGLRQLRPRAHRPLHTAQDRSASSPTPASSATASRSPPA